MNKQKNIYRHEIKYYINKLQAAELTLFLKKYMQLDPYADKTGSYWIRSLYFDTIDNKKYYEKIIGHNIRRKIRLRIYNLFTPTVKLELKNKYNNYVYKEAVSISRKDADKLIRRDCTPLLSYNETASNKLFALMHRNIYRPTIIIEYEREAYTYPFQNIRVCIDKNLCANFGTHDLFNKDIPVIPIINNSVFILEIKFNHMIPIFLQKVLSNFPIQKSQISKYCLGRYKLEN
jgi:hypothetical protein